MIIYDRIRNTEAQTCPLAHGLRCIKRIEDPVGLLHSLAAVMEFDAEGATLGKSTDLQDALTLRLQQCIDSVVDDIEEHLFHLIGIDHDKGRREFIIFRYSNAVLLEVVFAKIKGTFKQPNYICITLLHFLTARKRKQVLHDPLHALRLRLHLTNELQARVGQGLINEQLRVSHYGGQWII